MIKAELDLERSLSYIFYRIHTFAQLIKNKSRTGTGSVRQILFGPNAQRKTTLYESIDR